MRISRTRTATVPARGCPRQRAHALYAIDMVNVVPTLELKAAHVLVALLPIKTENQSLSLSWFS
ncbi:hypothetical protein L917_09164 [Phytophthora nicotianae]|uniref:Uncharacterized protein n=2 Tax=Phytophthora nicotianae TaxID=4792 RepID=W2L5B7_PHYNI|nr:hypothetical protein L917_09164 [Phytophthora nicotianae]